MTSLQTTNELDRKISTFKIALNVTHIVPLEVMGQRAQFGLRRIGECAYETRIFIGGNWSERSVTSLKGDESVRDIIRLSVAVPYRFVK